MSATPLAPSLRIRDLSTDTVVCQTSILLDWEIKWSLSRVTTYKVELQLGDVAALAIVDANGGPSGTGPALPYLGELILGGNVVDCRFLLTTPQITISATGSLILAGTDIFDLYSRTGVDRVTFHSVSVSDMLTAAPGTIPVVGSSGLILTGGTLPFQKGLFQTVPGRSSWAGQGELRMTPIIDPALKTGLNGGPILLDMDFNADMIDAGLDAIMAAVAGFYLPGDPAPMGTRGSWVADSSDASLNLTGQTRGIACGFWGAVSHLTFTNTITTVPVDETTLAPALDPIEWDPNTDEMASQAEFIGGKSDHGLPAGGSISALTTILYHHPRTSTNWYDSLLVAGVTTGGNGGGGVFFTAQDGAWRPLSQSMDVTDLAYDAVGHLLYAASLDGVFVGSDNPSTAAGPWQQVGGLRLPVTKIVVPMPALTIGPGGGPTSADTGLYLYLQLPDGTLVPQDPSAVANQFDLNLVYIPGGAYSQVIVALVSGSGGGADGIYVNTTASASAALGHAGWTQVVASSSIIDMGASLTTLYYADSNNPAYLQSCSLAGVPFPAHLTPSVYGGNPAITGIDSQQDSGYTYIRTAAGALGLFVVLPGGTGMGNANPDGTLLDPNGDPVLVNRLCENRPRSTMNNGAVAPLFAMTDSGPFWSPSPLGGQWHSCTDQSAIGSATVSLFTMGAEQTVLSRQLTRLYAGGGNAIYQSNTGGIWWRNLLNDLLDLGPFWVELARQCGDIPYPDNLRSNLGTLGGFVPDSFGTTVPVPNGNPRQLPPGYLWSRRLDEHSDFTYRLVNLGSSDPHNGIEFAELSELQTNALMGAITASERLALTHVRWLSNASTPQTRMALHSAFWTQEAKLRTTRPTHRITAQIVEKFTGADGTLRTLLNLNTPLWVLEHTIRRGQNGDAESESLVSSVQHATPPTPDEYAKSLTTTLKNLKRYRF
jgi:hypothetical protein